MTTGYVVELAIFQGPLDLLLHLIEQEELDITRIALAQVADQYLAHLEQIPQHDPEELSAFLVVAVKLLWIKSQALLPQPPTEEEEEVGADLVHQLQEFRRYKEAAQQMATWLEQGRRAFERMAPSPLPTPRPTELENATMEALLDALQLRLQELAPPEPPPPSPARRRVTLAEKARQIHNLLSAQAQVSFGRLLSEAPNREEVIVTLWAVLELFKRSWITVEQEELFGPIVVRQRSDIVLKWDRENQWWAELEDLD